MSCVLCFSIAAFSIALLFFLLFVSLWFPLLLITVCPYKFLCPLARLLLLFVPLFLRLFFSCFCSLCEHFPFSSSHAFFEFFLCYPLVHSVLWKPMEEGLAFTSSTFIISFKAALDYVCEQRPTNETKTKYARSSVFEQ